MIPDHTTQSHRFTDTAAAGIVADIGRSELRPGVAAKLYLESRRRTKDRIPVIISDQAVDLERLQPAIVRI